MNREHALTDSPIGALVIVREDDAIVRISMLHQKHLPDEGFFGERHDNGSPDARGQLASYFAGERQEFELPLVAHGTEFQVRVWRELSSIPYGETWSYAKLASEIGQPRAVRAVGLANGRNPHAVVVPCHRVIGSNGSLTGYAGGLEAKRLLLDLESTHRGAGRLGRDAFEVA